MKVLQFAFDPNGKSEYMPQNYSSRNCAVYTAAHDSDTVAGWVSHNKRRDNKFCREYLNVRKNSEISHAMIRFAWQSTADIAMTTIQEMWGYGSEARINVPSTIGNNWRWRAVKSDFSAENADMLRRLIQILLLVLGIIWILPLCWVILTSFREEPGSYTSYFWPKGFTVNNYVNLITKAQQFHFTKWFANTLLVSVISCIGSTLIVLAVSFALSRLRFNTNSASTYRQIRQL